MSDLIYLISEDYIRQNSQIEYNLDMQFIYKSIMDAQRLYLEPTLGSKLYNSILTKVDDGSISGITNYKSLLVSECQPMLLNYVLFLSIPHLQFKMSNKSINKLNSTNSETSALEEIKYLQDYYKNIAETYRERLKLHLIAHQYLYSELYTETEVDELTPSNDDYDCDYTFDN